MKISHKKVKKAAEYTFIALLLAPFVLFSFPSVIGAKQSFVVQSGSMEPSIPTGSAIWIYEAETTEIKEDDVITFQTGTLPITTHRVVNVVGEGDSKYFRTKGDAAEDVDRFNVYPPEVKGKVGLTVPYLGRLLTLPGSLKGFALLIIIPALLLAGGEIRKIYTEVKLHEQLNEPEKAYNSLLMSAFFVMLLSALTAGMLQLLPKATPSNIIISIVLGGFLLTSLIFGVISWLYRKSD